MTQRPPPTGAGTNASRPADPFLARLSAADVPLPPFDPAPLADPDRPPAEAHALAAALGCPDLFLIDAPGTDRAGMAADLAAEAVRAGKRVLVVAPAPAADAVILRLANYGEVVGRAVAPGEPVELLPPASAGRTAAAHSQAAVAGPRAKLADELARIAADEKTVRDRADAATEPSPAVADLRVRHTAAIAELDAAVRSATAAHAEKVADVARLRADLDAAVADAKKRHGVGGFFKSLVAKDDPAAKCAELQHQLAAAEAAAGELAAEVARKAVARDAAGPAHQTEVETLIRDETARRRAEADARLAELVAERERVSTAARDAEADLAAGAVARVRVAVGPVAAVGADPLVPADGPGFDLLVVADAEHLSEAEFHAAARHAGRWVMVGDISAPPRPGRPPGLFPRLWQRLHRRAWAAENGRLVARVIDGPRRDRLRAEPLADQPDVELRFTAGGRVELAEVAFPAGIPLTDAKAFLAAELGEVRLSVAGPVRWHEADGRLTACWPAADGAWVGGWADLGDGVHERVAGTGPDALTAAVAFDLAAGWDRTSAEEWVARHTAAARAARTAVVPRATDTGAQRGRALAGAGV